MAQQTPCNWVDGKYPLECTNCANHRHANPDSGHECKVAGKAKLWRRYADDDANGYDPPSCDYCISKEVDRFCDVDTTLGYSCLNCLKRDCTVSGEVMEKRPNLRQGFDQWFRHACDTCRNLKGKKPQDACSWLQDRAAWGSDPKRACQRCEASQMSCRDGGNLVAHPQNPRIPDSWSASHRLNDGWAELRGISPWRRNCKSCGQHGNHCRAMADSAQNACNRCFQMGLDCVDEQDPNWYYPIYDLSRVGFGNFMPLHTCRRCVETDRRCDRQRPCDSCVAAGEDNGYDQFEQSSVQTFNCIKGRISPQPGPLYYLALGYGAGGVNDVKDGSRLEHWIGPAEPVYSMDGGTDANRMGVSAAAENMRKVVKPNGAPPHGAAGGPLNDKLPSRLKAQELADMIVQFWPGAFLPNQHPEYQAQLEQLREKREALTQGHASRPRNRRRVAAQDGGNQGANQDASESDGSNAGGQQQPGPNGGQQPAGQNLGQLPPAPNPGQLPPGPNLGQLPPWWIDMGQQQAAANMGQQPGAPAAGNMLLPNAQAANAGGLAMGNAALPPPQNQAAPALNNDGNDPFMGVAGPAVVPPLTPGQLAQQPGALMAPPPQQQRLPGQAPGGFRTYPFDGGFDPMLNFVSLFETCRWNESKPTDHVASHWEPKAVARKSAGQPMPYYTVLQVVNSRSMPWGQVKFHDPLATVLLELPPRWPGPGALHCTEHANPLGSGNVCGIRAAPHQVCMAEEHLSDPMDGQTICDPCAVATADVLVQDGPNAITANAILSMRAYLCASCAVRYSFNTAEMQSLMYHGVRRVWGARFPTGLTAKGRLTVNHDIEMEFVHDPLPATGCACGTKMFGQRLCLAHRLLYANEALDQLTRMIESRDERFPSPCCPGCMLHKEPPLANSYHWAGDPGTPQAWICLLCNDAVINRPNRALVPGWQGWFSLPPDSWLEQNLDN